MTSWRGSLAALAGVRVAIPLVVLAVSPHEHSRFTGDAPAYYSTARALISGFKGPQAAALLLVPAGAIAAWRLRRRSAGWALVVLALALSLAAAAGIAGMDDSPAGAVGWPLLWAVPLAPLRALHAAGHDGAFAAGLVLSLAANAGTVVATAYAGLFATGRRSVGLLAAALFALFPGWSWLLNGTRGWENGTWDTDAGLHMLTEPLSTCLCATGVALLLGPRTPTRLALAGIALGYATVTRPTNGILAALALVLLAWRDRRAALPYAAGALAVAPIYLAFLPKRTGYDLRPAADRHGALFGARYVGSTWWDSLLWGPRAWAILVPLAVLGALCVRSRWALALLAGWALSNVVVYSFVRATAEHPRYLLASLPAVLVLWAAGGKRFVRILGARLGPD